MASKRKKNNLVKRYELQSQLALSGLVFGQKPGDTSGMVDCWSVKTLKPYKIGPSIGWALAECHFKFAFLLMVISKESNGKERIVTEYDKMAAPYMQADLIDYLNARHDAIIDNEKARGNDVISAGWATCPVPKLNDDELMQRMVDILLS